MGHLGVQLSASEGEQNEQLHAVMHLPTSREIAATQDSLVCNPDLNDDEDACIFDNNDALKEFVWGVQQDKKDFGAAYEQ